jgi:hypothetical protein
MTTALFLLALAALSALNMLLLLTIRTDIIRLWPTPGAGELAKPDFLAAFPRRSRADRCAGYLAVRGVARLRA